MILVVENEKDKLDNTCEMIKKQRGNEEIKSFDNSPAALKCARKNKVEIAFIDVKLPEMDGFVLVGMVVLWILVAFLVVLIRILFRFAL